LLIIVLGIYSYLLRIYQISPYLDRGKNLDILFWIRLDMDGVVQVRDLALDNDRSAPKYFLIYPI
jgi:hypothetical protein